MHSPFDLDIYVAHLQTERLREAAAERLASQVRRPRPARRSRLAATLHRLANQLDAPPVSVAATRAPQP
jgi:hypothetical protein